jgi:hypothetical protein
MTRRIQERGEGKVGCIVSLVILGVAIAAGLKIIPVYYANNNLKDVAIRKAESAAGRPTEALVKELQQEARNLEIQEALAPDAITAVKKKGADMTNIIVTLKYSRNIDLYGITTITIPTNEKIDRPVLEGIR